MPNQHGGYRKPSSPAAVSGPGALSKRTDGRPQPVRDLPDAEYGGNADFREMQQGAPMASGPSMASGGGGTPGPDLSQLIPMDAASQMPDQPVTHGADAGAGAGSDVLGLPEPGMKSELAVIGKYLPTMIRIADSPNATPAYRAYVRKLLAHA